MKEKENSSLFDMDELQESVDTCVANALRHTGWPRQFRMHDGYIRLTVDKLPDGYLAAAAFSGRVVEYKDADLGKALAKVSLDDLYTERDRVWAMANAAARDWSDDPENDQDLMEGGIEAHCRQALCTGDTLMFILQVAVWSGGRLEVFTATGRAGEYAKARDCVMKQYDAAHGDAVTKA